MNKQKNEAAVALGKQSWATFTKGKKKKDVREAMRTMSMKRWGKSKK